MRQSRLAKQRLRKDLAHSTWKGDPTAGVVFEPGVSPTTARWMLGLFGLMYTVYILVMFILFYRADATLDVRSELISFMVQCLLPLVALAAGYYLGHRNRHRNRRTAGSRA